MSQTEAGLGDELRRLVVERSHDRVTLLDPDGTIVYASPAWRTMLGWDPEEVVGTVLYLAKPASAMMTGHVIALDGGYTAQ